MINLGKLKIPKIKIDQSIPIPDTNMQIRLFLQYSNLVEKTKIGCEVVKQLKQDGRVKALEGKMISHGSGSQIFEINRLAMWFLWCANENGIEKANTYLDSFLDSKEIEVTNVLWVTGFEVEEPIALKNGYIIQPINKMPDSGEKEYFIQNKIEYAFQTAITPKCAITKSCTINKLRGNNPPSLPKNNEEFWDISSHLYNIALLLNAIDGVSSLPYYSTSYADPTTPFGLFSSLGGGSIVYDVVDRSDSKLTVKSKDAINELVDAYNKHNDPEKNRIKIILSRLSQAKRRIQIEDKILDLGIALEMLLLHDNPNNEQLTLTFRLRGSWLLGKTAEQRTEIYGDLNKIYNYRSQVAHSGVLCGGDVRKVRNSFSKYQSIAENVCQAIIKNGKPEWKKLILNTK